MYQQNPVYNYNSVCYYLAYFVVEPTVWPNTEAPWCVLICSSILRYQFFTLCEAINSLCALQPWNECMPPYMAWNITCMVYFTALVTHTVQNIIYMMNFALKQMHILKYTYMHGLPEISHTLYTFKTYNNSDANSIACKVIQTLSCSIPECTKGYYKRLQL